MFNIISKMNSTFGTIGKATTDKLTEMVDGKNSSFRINVKNIIWTKNGHACRSTSAKIGHFFAFLPSSWMKLYSYWTSCHVSSSFGCLYLWILEINSEQYFYMLVSAYLIYGNCRGLFVYFIHFVQIIIYLNLIQLLQNCWEKTLKWALI